MDPWGQRHEDALLRTLWSASNSMAWGEQFTHISEVHQDGSGVHVTLITNAFPQAVSLDKVGSSSMAGIHAHLRGCRQGISRASGMPLSAKTCQQAVSLEAVVAGTSPWPVHYP